MAWRRWQVNLAGIGVSVIEASVTKLAREVMHVSLTGVTAPSSTSPLQRQRNYGKLRLAPAHSSVKRSGSAFGCVQ